MSAAVPIDSVIEAAYLAMPEERRATVTAETIEFLRTAPAGAPDPSTVIAESGVDRRDVVIAGYQGDDIGLTVLTPRDAAPQSPGVVQIHSGGMILGDRFSELGQWLPWATECGAVVVTVEYRRAPEFPDPYPVEDCYAALRWVSDNARQLGIDPDAIVLTGSSAGGGLAAGVALLARDRGGATLAGQMLMYPMLDDRESETMLQLADAPLWNRASNDTGWGSLLGNRRGTDDVSIYAAPGRATDLSGLAPTYVECGAVDLFREEDVQFARTLWASGVDTEFHVWPGAIHGFDVLAPQAAVSAAAVCARRAWLSRITSW